MIHPSAQIDPTAVLAKEVTIGPFAIIEAGVRLGQGCSISAHAIVKRGTVLGDGVKVDHFAVVGGDPQDLAFDAQIISRVEVGARTVIREHVTIHRASHVAHDCSLGKAVILANGCMLGGHVQVGDGAFISGGVAVHQFCRIGAGSLTSGNAVITEDVPPQALAHGRNELAGLNLIGLRRRAISAASITELKRAYHQVYSPGTTCTTQAQLAIDSGAYQSPEALDFLHFFLGGKRGRFASPV